MKRTFLFLSVFAMAITGVMVTPQESSAVPAFARQTGYECNSCHFQYFPKLSAMGRAFKMGGFTDTSIDLIEGDNISLPATMPVSFLTKFRYLMQSNKTSGDPKSGAERGEIEVPDEATFFVGGRLASNIGYALEVADHGFGKGAVLFGIPTGSDLKLGVYVQATDGHGPANGFELNNTGFLRGQRGWEDRKGVYAGQWVGVASAATGLGLYGGSDMFWFNVGLWGPADKFGGGTTIDTGFDLAVYYRAAFTPNIAGFDASIGVVGASGTVKCVECAPAHEDGSHPVTEIKTDMTGADIQLQGEVSGMSLEIGGSYVTGGEDNWIGGTKKTAFNVGAMLGLTPAFGVKANYLNTEVDGGNKENATAIGLWYQFAQNVQLHPEYVIMGGDSSVDNKLTLLLFIGY